MAIIVEHEKRRQKILETALDVFVAQGFEDATYQKIAEQCKINRTTLYLYFRNKREIFNYSIKQLMAKVEGDISAVRKNDKLSHPEKIIRILSFVLDRLEEHRRLLQVILTTLLGLKDPDTRVRRRTVRMRHILATVVIDGIKAGQLKKTAVHTVDELLYGLIETALFRLVVLKRKNISELKPVIDLAVKSLTAGKP
ncbi:MAG: TetR/AcrR family transcriptional regulator [Treponema sp.]|jgi:AcrR family transcriptional regulator|nr:TetR/AcrR family transcriptional regulator [Treponema sp.]